MRISPSSSGPSPFVSISLNWQGGNPNGLGEELNMEGYGVLSPLLELSFDPHDPQNFASGFLLGAAASDADDDFESGLFTVGVGSSSWRVAPHCVQNFKCDSIDWPQEVQNLSIDGLFTAMVVPHCVQNFSLLANSWLH
jgi:hypothetical protein